MKTKINDKAPNKVVYQKQQLQYVLNFFTNCFHFQFFQFKIGSKTGIEHKISITLNKKAIIYIKIYYK